MIAAARLTLRTEKVSDADMAFQPSLDMRYVKQYHEVNVPFDVGGADVVARFHGEHDRRYGYHLAEQKTPVEVINVRLRSIGRTVKPSFPEMKKGGADPKLARKGSRRAWVPEKQSFEEVPTYDAEKLENGMRLSGPAIVDQANTTLFLSAAYDLVCDRYGNYVGYRRDAKDRLPKSILELLR